MLRLEQRLNPIVCPKRFYYGAFHLFDPASEDLQMLISASIVSTFMAIPNINHMIKSKKTDGAIIVALIAAMLLI